MQAQQEALDLHCPEVYFIMEKITIVKQHYYYYYYYYYHHHHIN